MNKGYTIAELLITLGIIAVISALLGVAIVKLKPDSDKVMYLKQYDAVMNVTSEIVNNSRLYPTCQDSENTTGEENWDCTKRPLFNIAQTNAGGKSVEGIGKYCDLLAMMLSGKKLADNSCSLNPTYADGKWTPTFTTKNGSEWLVSTSRSTFGDAENGYSASYQTEVYFDLNGANGPNCLYEKDKCKKPDRFKLLVAADGTTIVADPVGQAYVNTRKNWNKKSLEIEDNAGIIANLNTNLKDFALQRCGAAAEKDDHVCPEGEVWDGISCVKITGNDTSYPTLLISIGAIFSKYGELKGVCGMTAFDVIVSTDEDVPVKEDIAVNVAWLDETGQGNQLGCVISKGDCYCSADVLTASNVEDFGNILRQSNSLSSYSKYVDFDGVKNENYYDYQMLNSRSKMYVKVTTYPAEVPYDVTDYPTPVDCGCQFVNVTD